ncbi:MAG: plasmid pRiA4b ORF-3 family protein [bacterium]
MKKQTGFDKVLQFKITLNDSSPRIWRRILVPASYTFFDLHCAIQNAMGWIDSHLHGFRFVNKKNNYRTINIGFPLPDDDVEYMDRLIDERTAKIADYFSKISKQCVYEYDFGDGWEHAIIFERVLPRDSKLIYPQCVAGENACPPEDCGGVWGYEDLQKILKNPRRKEHKDMLDWLGLDDPKDFDSHEFDPKEIYFENPKKRLAAWSKGFRM